MPQKGATDPVQLFSSCRASHTFRTSSFGSYFRLFLFVLLEAFSVFLSKLFNLLLFSLFFVNDLLNALLSSLILSPLFIFSSSIAFFSSTTFLVGYFLKINNPFVSPIPLLLEGSKFPAYFQEVIHSSIPSIPVK